MGFISETYIGNARFVKSLKLRFKSNITGIFKIDIYRVVGDICTK